MSQGSKVTREDVMHGFRKGAEIGKSRKTKEVVETMSWKQRQQHTAVNVQRLAEEWNTSEVQEQSK